MITITKKGFELLEREKEKMNEEGFKEKILDELYSLAEEKSKLLHRVDMEQRENRKLKAEVEELKEEVMRLKAKLFDILDKD